MKYKELNPELIKNHSEGVYSGGLQYIKISPRGLHNFYFQIITSPFGNCQIFSIAWFNYFLRDCDNNEFIDNLKYCNELIGKKKHIIN